MTFRKTRERRVSCSGIVYEKAVGKKNRGTERIEMIRRKFEKKEGETKEKVEVEKSGMEEQEEWRK